jgi:hypothetical protein
LAGVPREARALRVWPAPPHLSRPISHAGLRQTAAFRGTKSHRANVLEANRTDRLHQASQLSTWAAVSF